MKIRKEFITYETGKESLLVPGGGAGFSGLVKGNKTVKWLFSVLGSRKYYIVILTIIHALHGASGVLYALLLRQIVDSAVDHDSTGFWKGILFVVLLVPSQL